MLYSPHANIIRYSNGTLVKLVATSREFISPDYDFQKDVGTYQPPSITVTAQTQGNIKIGAWELSKDGGKTFDEIKNEPGITVGEGYLVVLPVKQLFASGNIVIKCVADDAQHYDTITIAREVDPEIVYRRAYTDIQQTNNRIMLIASDEQLAQFTSARTMMSKVAEIELTAEEFRTNVTANYSTKNYVTQATQTAQSTAITTSQTYADGVASTAKSEAITTANTHADEAASSAEANAKSFASTEAQTAESNAKIYAGTAADTAEANAKSYADGAAGNAEQSAKDYTDGQLVYYPTITEMGTAIEQSAQRILLTASETYSTKQDLISATDGTFTLQAPREYNDETGRTTFQARVYKNDVNVTDDFSNTRFLWYLTSESDPTPVSKGTGKTLAIANTEAGYNGSVILRFLTPNNVNLELEVPLIQKSAISSKFAELEVANDQISARVTEQYTTITDETDTKLANLESTLTIKADGIETSVNNKFNDYSTTTQMNGAIKAVDDKFANYSTKTETQSAVSKVDTDAKSYANTAETNAKNHADTAAQTVDGNAKGYADTAESNAKDYANGAAQYAENEAREYTNLQLTRYSTTEQMNSAIRQSADSITLETQQTYSTKQELISATNGIYMLQAPYTYDSKNGLTKFEAKVYKNGLDVTENFPANEFWWYIKTEEDPDWDTVTSGYTFQVSNSLVGYNGAVILEWAGSGHQLLTLEVPIYAKGAISSKFAELEVADEGISARVSEQYTTITGETQTKISNLGSEFNIRADGISSQVAENAKGKNIISSINQTAEEVRISAGKISLEGIVTANSNFKINEDGSMETISAKVGGININSDSIYTTGHTAVTSTTPGFILKSDGSFGFGDDVSYIKYYKNNKNVWVAEANFSKLTLSTTDSLVIGGSTAATQSDINSIKTKAEAAQSTADSATTKANQATTAASTATTTANEAKTAATTATSTANEAKTAATSATSTANAAKDTADTASTTAEDAKTVADTASTTAEEAKTAATTANTTANQAKTTATTANTTANQAKTTATTANTNANEAKTAASTAQGTANEAKASAANAQGTADEAKSLATDAGAEAEEAKKTATNFLYFDENTGLVVSEVGASVGSDAKPHNIQIKGDGIYFRTKSTVLGCINGTAFTLYRPGSTLKEMMKLDKDGLYFYRTNNNDVTAKYTSNGLEVISGKIAAFNIAGNEITGSYEQKTTDSEGQEVTKTYSLAIRSPRNTSTRAIELLDGGSSPSFYLTYAGALYTNKATIGGMHVESGAIYSGSHKAYNSSNVGFYLGSAGDFSVGDGTSYIRYYKSGDAWKLDIRATELKFGGVPVASTSDVDSAKATANEAKTAATSATTAANEAKTAAQTATSTATSATTAANEAKTTANTANTTAGQAKTTANTANTTANEAKSTANQANTTANSANTTALTANATANDAKTAAGEAAKTATNYLFADSTGLYISQNGTGYTSGGYMRLHSAGLQICSGSNNLAALTGSALYFYVSNKIRAQFGAETKFLDTNGTEILTINSKGLTCYDSNNNGLSIANGAFNVYATNGESRYNVFRADQYGIKIRSKTGAYVFTSDQTGKATFSQTLYGTYIQLTDILSASSVTTTNGFSVVASDGTTKASISSTGQISGAKGVFSGKVALNGGASLKSNKITLSDPGLLCYASDGETIGWQFKSGSSRRYKDIHRDLTSEDVSAFYNLRPVLAEYKAGYLSDDDPWNGVIMPMMIAEDIEDAFPGCTHKDEEGLPRDYNDHVMLSVHQQMILDQNERIQTLESEVAELKEIIRRLVDGKAN